MLEKNCHFWSCSISHSFVRICDIYLENSLFFYFGFDIEKHDTRLYCYTSSYVFYIKSPIIYLMLSRKNMLHFITAENGLPYRLLWKIDILS